MAAIDVPCSGSWWKIGVNDAKFSKIPHNNASINVKLRGGGGGPLAYAGYLTSIAFPTLGNLTKNLGPSVGTFPFLCGGMGPSHIVPFIQKLCLPLLIFKVGI